MSDVFGWVTAPTSIGSWSIAARGDQIVAVVYGLEDELERQVSRRFSSARLGRKDTSLKKYVARSLAGDRFPVRLFDWQGVGTFDLSVLKTLLRVPSGSWVSYGELAQLSGRAGAARAVGGAMRRNPFPLMVPCHRVLPSTGRVGNYSGGGPSVKTWLLAHESELRAG